LKTIEV